MAAAGNFACGNRQMMLHEVRGAFEQVFGRAGSASAWSSSTTWRTTSPSARSTRSTARPQAVWVHRKGATRAFGPGRPEVPADYRDVGQPVIIPGDMGTESWLLVGTAKAMAETFGSTCHGAGRMLSRHAARKVKSGAEVRRELEAAGIVVKTAAVELARRRGALRLQGRERGRGRGRRGGAVAQGRAPAPAGRAQGLTRKPRAEAARGLLDPACYALGCSSFAAASCFVISTMCR